MSKPTAGWDKIGDRYYRKIPLYTDVFDPDLELENYAISAAPYAGALALHRDESKVHAYRNLDNVKSSIDIYSSAGRIIKQINWDKGPISGIGWSEDETLIVVARDGVVRAYPNLTDDFTPFSLGNGAEDHGVVECRFWPTGFVALLGNNQLIAVLRYDDPRPRLLATPPSDKVFSWTVIPPAYTTSRSAEVLLSIGQTINVVDSSDSEDRMLQNGPFRHISVSPNGRFVALYTDDGKVWVITSDFQDKLSEYNSRAKSPPLDMQWCGNDAVVLAWEDEVHLIGPNGVASKHLYDAWVHLIPDVDGIRILTKESCEFLQKVPDVTEDIFRIGATSSASVLLDAVDHLERRSPKADDNVQLIKPNLIDAVSLCIEAAGHEFDTHWQKQLLKAASFGKSVLDHFDSDMFLSMCETVRVLNAARFYQIGLPISYEQYSRLTPERLVQRLVNRREYSLALRISEYLQLPVNRIYIHWATEKVRVSADDEDSICSQIVQKLSGKRGVSYEAIATAAYEEGRQNLATSLLNHEPQPSRQIPLLLSMSEDTLALDKAIDSGDTDLVLYVLLYLRKRLPLANFFRTINTRPIASALVESTALSEDRELLKDLYYQDDRRLDGAILLFYDALKQPDVQNKIDRLKPASKLLQDSKEFSFQARSIEETARLLRIQEGLDNDASIKAALPSTTSDSTDVGEDAVGATDSPQTLKFTGLTLNATIHQLIMLHQSKRAQKLASDFHLSDRTVWQLRLRALVQARSWRELEDLGKNSKKSPIGWEVFFKDILAAGNARLAGNVFVAKCTGLTYKERADMYVRCGLIAKAAEEAVKGKDRELLDELRALATGRDAVEVERLANTMGKK